MLEVRNISKQFPAVKALSGVSLAFAAGRVHGVIGENGAGKSTLMKILSGIEQPDGGEILLEGKAVHFRNPGEAMAAGIVMIHQELNLIEPLSVAENIFLGREIRRGMVIDRAAQNRKAREALALVNADFEPDAPVSSLSLANKQLVEIAKAVSHDAKVLILDEPTAVLSEREIRSLFSLMADLRAQGLALVYISHILRDVIEVCDDVSVLRDGQLVAQVPAKEASPAQLASLMVGRELGDVYPEKTAAPQEPPILRVQGLSVPGWVRSLDLQLAPGELVGLAGLIGAGRTEAAEAIVGLRPHGGTIEVEGKAVAFRNPEEAKRSGIVYLSEDRKALGLHLAMSSKHNVTLANLRAYAHPIVDRKQETETVAKWTETLGIKIGDPDAPVLNLSGGNQQKVALAKWLDTQPKVLILDEPTRGVDVGAKREIYNLIHQLAQQGMACLLISSEMTELIGLCHRVLVMRSGEVEGELSGDELTEDAIMRLAAGVAA